jgi:hypothetical protein
VKEYNADCCKNDFNQLFNGKFIWFLTWKSKEKQPTQLQKMQGYLSFYLKKVAFSNLSIHLEYRFLEYLAFFSRP